MPYQTKPNNQTKKQELHNLSNWAWIIEVFISYQITMVHHLKHFKSLKWVAIIKLFWLKPNTCNLLKKTKFFTNIVTKNTPIKVSSNTLLTLTNEICKFNTGPDHCTLLFSIILVLLRAQYRKYSQDSLQTAGDIG